MARLFDYFSWDFAVPNTTVLVLFVYIFRWAKMSYMIKNNFISNNNRMCGFLRDLLASILEQLQLSPNFCNHLEIDKTRFATTLSSTVAIFSAEEHELKFSHHSLVRNNRFRNIFVEFSPFQCIVYVCMYS